jgi:putative flippase GtrA
VTTPTRRELVSFAVVGAFGYAADLTVFSCLRGPAGLDPLTSKTVAFLVGCTLAYAGNARYTYRHMRVGGARPYAAYCVVSTAGALVQLICLAVSHYGLGFTSQRADTFSGSVIGMGLATVLRFLGTRILVFRHDINRMAG